MSVVRQDNKNITQVALFPNKHQLNYLKELVKPILAIPFIGFPNM
jgi:hypothetical protein